MDNEKTILGYIVCRECLTPKAIYQGSGKRAAYVYGRCECGPDNRTGKPAQVTMTAYKPLEEVEAEIDAIKANALAKQRQPQSQSEPQSVVSPGSESKPIGTATCVGIGAVAGLLFGGIIKTIKAVA